MTDDSLVVTFMNGPADGRWVIVHNPTIAIGRGPANDVVIDFDPKVAETHLVIEHHAGQWQLVDRSGGAGVRVSGMALVERTELRSDALLTLGDTQLRISLAASD
jgi:pSer/pThr/pTyr-binding forkhead associated (FHA) protein